MLSGERGTTAGLLRTKGNVGKVKSREGRVVYEDFWYTPGGCKGEKNFEMMLMGDRRG